MFRDRTDAGQRLAGQLAGFADRPEVVVAALPRGGVPVGYAVARALRVPLDVIVVRKLGLPTQPELAMGAVAEGGARVVDERLVHLAGVSDREFAAVERRERAAVERRARDLRGVRPPVPLAGMTVLIVDDGVATGATAVAACQVARARGAGRVVVAVPVAAGDALTRLRGVADEVVCLESPRRLFAVGMAYSDFAPVSDGQVRALLERSALPAAPQPAATAPPVSATALTLPAGNVLLTGDLAVPAGAPGLVVFAHGSGSSRHSPRNRHVASVLTGAGLGTLLFDLLTREEERWREAVFDIDLLARRLVDVTRHLRTLPGIPRHIGYFGASTGAAAALAAATDPAAEIAAIVSRGGRPDLAGPALPLVRAPTLLIVGSRDQQVLALNRAAQARLRCPSRLAVVPGASHLFEEPGTLDAAARLAAEWFTAHLRAPATETAPEATAAAAGPRHRR